MEDIKNVQELNEGQLSDTVGGVGQARWITYTISRGDTLNKIAHRFGVSVANLCEWNLIGDPEYMAAGNKLQILTRR